MQQLAMGDWAAQQQMGGNLCGQHWGEHSATQSTHWEGGPIPGVSHTATDIAEATRGMSVGRAIEYLSGQEEPAIYPWRGKPFVLPERSAMRRIADVVVAAGWVMMLLFLVALLVASILGWTP